jgi:hypothetical protein
MKQAVRILILPLAFAVSAPAVAGPIDDFFRASGAKSEDIIISKSPPQVNLSYDLDADLKHAFEDGYLVLGVSSWVGRTQDPKNVSRFAKKINASIAFVHLRYIETVSGGTQVMMMPIIGGYGGMIGGAHPVSFDKYEQTTYFLAKVKPESIGLGIHFDPLTPIQARAIGSGKGLSIKAVVRGAPAFDADIIAGDIILTIAGQDVSTADRLIRTKVDCAGQTVPVEIIRNGQPQILQITMPTAAPVQAKRRK